MSARAQTQGTTPHVAYPTTSTTPRVLIQGSTQQFSSLFLIITRSYGDIFTNASMCSPSKASYGGPLIKSNVAPRIECHRGWQVLFSVTWS